MSEVVLEFKGLEKCSLIEWPGRMVAIAYTPGCNLRCPYCQNPDLIENPSELPTVTQEDVLNHLESGENLLDGLIVTGGEPTIHKGLIGFAGRVKEAGFEFGLETNGTKPRVLKELIDNGLTDYVAMDVKAPLGKSKYHSIVRRKISISNIRESIQLLLGSRIDYEFRTTVAPGLLTLKDFKKIARELRGAKRYCIQQFNPKITLDKSFQELNPYSPSLLEEICDRIKGEFNECEIRGV